VRLFFSRFVDDVALLSLRSDCQQRQQQQQQQGNIMMKALAGAGERNEAEISTI